ncbi:ribbon-helix-helix domain-containing protein [Yoonia sp.]|uniref:ribbon-helix-helix domain-containing protein n=1 Tax=Yoonia sp. TaxID=2212373 RepID=UPI003D4CAE1C
MCQIFAGQDPSRYEYVTRRIRLNGQSTSVRLERSFWRIVDQMAQKDCLTTPAFLSKLHSEVLEQKGEVTNFSSLLRCACTIYLGELQKVPQQLPSQTAQFAAE